MASIGRILKWTNWEKTVPCSFCFRRRPCAELLEFAEVYDSVWDWSMGVRVVKLLVRGRSEWGQILCGKGS